MTAWIPWAALVWLEPVVPARMPAPVAAEAPQTSPPAPMVAPAARLDPEPPSPQEAPTLETPPAASPSQSGEIPETPAPGPAPPRDGELAGGDRESPVLRLRRPSRGRRTLEELELCPSDEAGCTSPGEERGLPDTLLGAPRPAPLQMRRAAGAGALGFLVGLGTGFYYGGDPTQGLAFTLVDAVLWASLTGTVVALNQLVIRHDFRSGKSLKKDQRKFGRRERSLYNASWGIVGLLICSHLYQGFGAIRAAQKTNAVLSDFAFVPLGGGGAVEYRRSF